MRSRLIIPIMLLLMAWTAPAFSALSAGAKASAAAAAVNTVTTAGVTTQSTGSGFWLSVGWHSGATVNTPTDNKGNAYVQVGSTQVDGSWSWARYYCATGAGGSGHTFTVTTTGSVALVQILAQELITTNGNGVVLDQTAQQQLNVASWVSPSVTTTSANEILVGGWLGHTSSGTASFTANSSFALGPTILDGSFDNSAAVETRVVSATGSYHADFSVSGITWGTNNQDLTIDTFSEASSGITFVQSQQAEWSSGSTIATTYPAPTTTGESADGEPEMEYGADPDECGGECVGRLDLPSGCGDEQCHAQCGRLLQGKCDGRQ